MSDSEEKEVDGEISWISTGLVMLIHRTLNTSGSS